MENDKLNNIKEKILELRQNLLDTTRRNKLLNFKPLRRSIKIIDENILELFNIFVVEEDYMEFSPIPKSDEKKLAIGTDNLWKMPVSRKQIPDRHVDRFLQTNLDEETLQKRLFRLFQMYKTNLSEQGFNDFFLALGFLEWNEIEHSEIIYKSPLILIPVKIYRESVQDPFKIAWDKEDIQLNISLESKLKEQDVVLPNVELNSKENVNNYFNEIEFIIKEKGWKINNDIYLNDFNFKKFIMYKDLESENWKSLENNEISQVFFPTERDHEYFDEENVDTLDIHNVFNVVDADSSQIAVIEEVKKGQSLVVEGPPGTGKSQTIVNLIAELMANKKTILFVSEKMAALEVVKSRLESIDLGEGCLELHSNKSNKREVLADLENTLNRAQYGLNDISETFQDLNRTKKLLNSYLKILTQEYGSTGYSAYDLIGIMDFNARVIEKYSNNEPFTVNLSNLDYLDSSKRGKLLGDISQIKDYYNDVKPVLRNPWKSTNFNELTRNDMEKIQNKSLNHILNEINELNNTINKIVEISKTERLDSFNKLNEYCDNLPLLKENPKLINDDLDSLIENIKAYQNGIVDISDETIFNNDLKLFKSNLDVLKDDAKKLEIVDNFMEDNLKLLFDIIKDNYSCVNELFNILKKIQQFTGAKNLEKMGELDNYCNNLLLLKENPKIIKDVDLNDLIENIELYQNRIVDISDETIFNDDLELFKSDLDVLKDDAKKLEIVDNFMEENLKLLFDIIKDNSSSVNELFNILKKIQQFTGAKNLEKMGELDNYCNNLLLLKENPKIIEHSNIGI